MALHTKFATAAICFALMLLCSHSGDWSLLVETAAAETTTPTSNIHTGMATVAVTIAHAMETVAFIIFHFLEYFLDPLFIISITETDGLRNLWQYSRDIMNVLFAFMLIGVGIFTVVNYEAGKSILNDKFKKFILAVILVNFSWFFPRLILDVANVLTATIYQLPAGLNGGSIECYKDPPDNTKQCDVIDEIKFFKSCQPVPSGFVSRGIVCYKTIPWDSQTNTSYGILNGLVYNYGRLGQLTRVLNPAAGPSSSGSPSTRFIESMMFLTHIIFVLILMAMLFLPMIAMFIVFLIRIPIIWVTIAFMPFMFIGYLADDKLTPGFNSFDIFKHFVKAAFLPVAIAVPFAVGFMLITEIGNINCPTGATFKPLCDPSGPFLHNVTTLWQLLILLIAMIVIWFGFWSAIKIDTIYEQSTAGLKNFGESVGKLGLKLPLSVPFIPSGKGKPISILGADDAVRRINSSLSSGAGPLESLGAASAGSSAAGTGKAISDVMNNPKSETNTNLKRIISELGTKKTGAGGKAITNAEISTKIQQVFNEKKVRAELPANITQKQFEESVRNSSEFKSKIEELQKDTSGTP